MRSAGRASGRATCTARSAARARRCRPARGSAGEEPCRSPASDGLHVLAELEPALVVERVPVDDRVEDPAQRNALAGFAFELGSDRVDRQRPDARGNRALVDLQLDGDLAIPRGPLEDRVERGLEVVDVLEGEVEPRGDPAEHDVRDPVEGFLARNSELDLVSGHDVLSTNGRRALTVSTGSGRRTMVPQPTTVPSPS